MTAAWVLVPCLVRLRDEFDQVAPVRDHASDGTIGDTAHQDSQSDHNDDEAGNVPIRDADKKHEVHALDVDADLREPGLTMAVVVAFLLARCRSGVEKRLRYMIFDRTIYEASNGWRARPYTGPSPHTEHAHFSSSYVTELEASTASWHLEDIPVALTSADKAWIAAQIKENAPASELAAFVMRDQADGTPTSVAGNAVWAQGIPNGTKPTAERDLAWQVVRDLGIAVAELREQVTELAALVKTPA